MFGYFKVDHYLKIDYKYFRLRAGGFKNFEIRKNDRDYKVGQIVMLNEVDADRKETGHHELVVITSITNYEQKDGFIVFGTEDPTKISSDYVKLINEAIEKDTNG